MTDGINNQQVPNEAPVKTVTDQQVPDMTSMETITDQRLCDHPDNAHTEVITVQQISDDVPMNKQLTSTGTKNAFELFSHKREIM